jgi:tight adherence protein C
LFGAIAPALAAQIPESGTEHKDFRNLLRGAGMYRPDAATSIYAMRFVFLFVPLIAAGIMIMISEKSQAVPILIGGVLVAVALSIMPRLYVYFRRRSRMNAIRNGLPDTMDMLSMCVGGGMPLSPSLDHIARQLTTCPEMAEELLILKRQAEVGSLKQALADFSSRVDLPEVRQFSGLLTRGERLGTKLAGSLSEQSDHLRQTRKRRHWSS